MNQEPDNRGNAARFFEYFLNREPAPEPAQRQFVPDAPINYVGDAVRAARQIKEFNAEIAELDLESAKAYLSVKLYGQEITHRYRSQAATILLQEIDRHNIKNHLRRQRLLVDAVEQHIEEKLKEKTWDYSTIEKVNKFNMGCNGMAEKRNDHWYWMFDRAQIKNNLNYNAPSVDESSFKLSHIVSPILALAGIAVGVVAAGYVVSKIMKYFTSQPYSTPTNAIIIPSIPTPYSQHSSIVTSPGQPQSTILDLSRVFTNISKSLSDIQDILQENNTLNHSLTHRVEDFIDASRMTWMEALKSAIWSNHLRK